jgi:hypothetical protein
MRSPCCLSVFQPVSVRLSACPPPLIFVRRLMRSPCYLFLCIPLVFFVFFVVHVVLKGNRRLVLPRTACS